MHRDVEPSLLRIVEPIVAAHGMELVCVELGGPRAEGGARGRARQQVRIVVDTPAGDGRVLLDDCARASREIGHALDSEDYFPGAYTLEVCSPGIDRVLGRPCDFERAVGGEVVIETREPLDGRRRFRGRLAGFDGQSTRVEVDGACVEIPLAAVSRANAIQPEAASSRPRPARRSRRAASRH